MKPEGDPMKINSENFEEKTSQEKLADDSNKRGEIDSTMPTGPDAEHFILNRKSEIEKIERPDHRFHEYWELSNLCKQYGQPKLAKEMMKLAHEAEREFMANPKVLEEETKEKIANLMSYHVNSSKEK
ncbi:MAG TPA: hypothetical protein PK950_01755 [Candidatus Paceibacterota bacterium]|nr:hypothetical protein [Candidatus Paceibacterota bacterium]